MRVEETLIKRTHGLRRDSPMFLSTVIRSPTVMPLKPLESAQRILHYLLHLHSRGLCASTRHTRANIPHAPSLRLFSLYALLLPTSIHASPYN